MTHCELRYNLIRKTAAKATVFRILLSFLLVSISLSSAAQKKGDSIYTILPDLEVRQTGRSQFKQTQDGDITIKSKDILKLTHTLGEIDFINQIRQLSRVSSTSDYASGLVIDGADPTQVQYLIDGAPVIFPYRFGGIFSTFNTPHYSSLSFSRLSNVSLLPRLGASFELSSAMRFKPGPEGLINVGMTASSLSLRAGLADRVSVSISGRISYVEQIYKRWLNNTSNSIGMSFHDLNATLAVKLSASDTIKTDFFMSGDKVGYDDSNYALYTGLDWKNTVANLSFHHGGRFRIKANAFYSAFKNTLSLRIPQFRLRGPSSFNSAGFSFSIGNPHTLNSLFSKWEAGARMNKDKGVPQWAILEMTDISDVESRMSSALPQHLYHASAFGRMVLSIIPDRINVIGEVSLGIYNSRSKTKDTYTRLLFSPRLSLQYLIKDGLLSLTVARVDQPLHQVGFSELGLASNFWIGACENAPIQHAIFLQGRFTRRLPWWALEVEAVAFWKGLKNQVEYQGQVLEVVNMDYDSFSRLIVSDGYNIGASLGLTRRYGLITGDISLSYGMGKRFIPSNPSQKWDALNAEGFSLKTSLVWHQGKHWEVSAGFLFSSGRRYTPVKALYMIAGNIAMEYGKRNSARLPSYQRLDLGATYIFSTGKRHPLRHLVNLSLLNAYGHKNVEMQYFVLDSEKGDYSLKRLYSLYRFLPSLSYTIEFQ